MIDTCSDANFTKTVTECCWNVAHGRSPLSTHIYRSGDIQTYKGKMTTKMILFPIDRLKALEKINRYTCKTACRCGI